MDVIYGVRAICRSGYFSCFCHLESFTMHPDTLTSWYFWIAVVCASVGELWLTV